MRVRIIILFLLVIGFVYRIYGLSINYPFWIDEFSSAEFAASILRTGSPKTITENWEPKTIIYQYIMAVSMKVFGINEFGARFPSVFIGTLSIFVVYLVFSYLFDRKIGLSVSILLTFFTMEIVWSRQARSYALFQLLAVFTLWSYWIFISHCTLKRWLLLVFSLTLCFLSHLLTVGLLLGFLIYFFLFERKKYSINCLLSLESSKKLIIFISFCATVIIFFIAGGAKIINDIVLYEEQTIKLFNHFLYYHSFFWRQYGMITFFSFLGILIAAKKGAKQDKFLITIIASYLFFVTFLVPWHDVRYLYPIFPILFFVYFSNFLWGITELFSIDLFLRKCLFFSLIFFIIANGYKFTIKPKKFYSPNTDMREIPLVNYDKVYGKIRLAAVSDKDVVVIDTWSPRIAWYLGRDYPLAYRIRNASEIEYKVINGRKIELGFGFGAVTSKEDLIKILKDNKKGYIFIDGHEIPYLPMEAVSFIDKNLKLEIKLDRFSLDPDPYDTWPAWLYSWGF